MKMGKYYGFLVESDTNFAVERPEAEECWVIFWEDAGIVIPWEKGDSPKQAILKWAAINSGHSWENCDTGSGQFCRGCGLTRPNG